MKVLAIRMLKSAWAGALCESVTSLLAGRGNDRGATLSTPNGCSGAPPARPGDNLGAVPRDLFISESDL